ncbi:squamosa promoter-binding-like protein 7 [Triticum dicoccoides]|uniref:squamosa promoter-binding-like protein 7 n=1 Tax=Triticum dicoccoides TaxID=85692 RepID=UPI000E7D1975|nr:squamosa promoter-binding-like protein 7 [Triticum dicoccoides]
MEGDGNARSRATLAWDLGVQWAPAASAAYPQHFLPPPGVASQQQHMQQELTSLKLGKRPSNLAGGQVAQMDGSGVGGGRAVVEGKRKEKAAGATATAAMPRCQVEGCHMVLAGAKEYHRRHKVCEAHSKAPRVIVHGAEQRFCQQCSRFHAMAEFDDAKRSCRRRLAGHNERRRKSNASDAMARGSAHAHGVASLVHGFVPYGGLPTSPAGALSLLSSARAAPWLVPTTPGDVFSARSSSAALDELIAENRAALLACHFFPQRSAGRPAAAEMAPAWHQAHQQAPPGHAVVGNGAGRDHGAPPPPAGHVTLDLMQAPATAGLPFRPMAQGRPAEDGDAGRGSGVWTPLQGAHAV